MNGFPGFEARRIFSKKNLFWLVLFFLLAQYLVYFGVARYKKILAEREAFLRYERLKVHQYINYEQYGSFGFRVILEPLPSIIFCHSSILPVESTVSVKDIIDIRSAYKGGRVFPAYGRIGDFAGVFFILGSLLMFYFGSNTFISVRFIRYHSAWRFVLGTISMRLILLITFFSVVMASAYLLALLWGISFSAGQSRVLFGFFMYMLLFLSFFFCLGLFMSALVKFKKELTVGTYLIWFILVVAVPVISSLNLEKRAKQINSNELINIKKLKNGKNLERKAGAYFKSLQDKKVKEIRHIARGFFEEYLNRVVPLNNRIEHELTRQVREVTKYHEKTSAFIPTLFYGYLSREIPGSGYHAYLDFLEYLMNLRKKFYSFYFKKRYHQIDQSVEGFASEEDQVFVLPGGMPETYWKGAGLTIVYSMLFLGAFFFMVHRFTGREIKARIPPGKKLLDEKQLESGKTYFRYCPDPVKKKEMIDFLKSRNAVIISKPEPALFDTGTSLSSWLRFEVIHRKLDTETLSEVLSLLGVKESHLESKIKSLDGETFLKAYLALKLCLDSNIYVFDDFLERGSKELENSLKSTLDILKPRAVVVYLSLRMYDVAVKGRIQPGHDELRLVKVDWKDISLR